MVDVAETGDIVTVEYDIRFLNGEVYDSNLGLDPLVFKLGQQFFFPGFEQAILGMHIGAEKTLTILAEHAFGPRLEELIKQIPKTQVPPHINTAKGSRVEIIQDGLPPIRGKIVESNNDFIVLDANPVVAGKDLKLYVKLHDIEVL